MNQTMLKTIKHQKIQLQTIETTTIKLIIKIIETIIKKTREKNIETTLITNFVTIAVNSNILHEIVQIFQNKQK